MRRTAVAVVSTVGLLLASPLAGPAAAAEGDNVVISETTGTGPTRVERSSVVVSTSDETVDNENLASASGVDCTGCRAVAVAFQAVLVPEPATRVAPRNQVEAINVNCLKCTSAAYAYQYVVSTDGVRALDRDGQARVRAVARRVDRVTRSGLSPAALGAELDRLEAEFKAAVDAGLTGGTPVSEERHRAQKGR